MILCMTHSLVYTSQFSCVISNQYSGFMGVLWLNGRQTAWGETKGWGFEARQCHCIVSLSKTHYTLLSTGSTQGDLPLHNWKIVD